MTRAKKAAARRTNHRDQQERGKCLALAVECSRGREPDAIVSAAGKFYAFVTGGDVTSPTHKARKISARVLS